MSTTRTTFNLFGNLFKIITGGHGARWFTVQEELHKTVLNLYLYKTLATPVITVDSAIGNEELTVDSIAGVNIGDVITLYEGERIYQTLVTGTATNTIELASALDYAFTTEALVETGAWDMSVDGSSTAQEFSIHSAPEVDFDIHMVNCSMLSTSDMDDGKFGSLTQLANGLVFRYVDTIVKHFALIVNNLGFREIGFDTEYSAKAPAGQYGFIASRTLQKVNGTNLLLTGADSAELKVLVRDDLTGLALLAIIACGNLNEQES